MKKTLIILFVFVLLISGGYMYLRYGVLTSGKVAQDVPKASSILDLRPALIAKLQELVKDGSDGLYNLRIEQLDPDVVASTVDIVNAVLTPDSIALARLDKSKMCPDDVFKIKFRKLHIDGIGLKDVFSSDKLNLEAITLNEPVIEVFHSEKSYNKNKRTTGDTVTLYKKLTKQLTSISIDKVIVFKGTVVNHNLVQNTKVTTYRDIAVNMTEILVDSSTQYDKSRFLFAKDATFSMKNYLSRTQDSLYFFKCGSVSLSTGRRLFEAKDIELISRLSKKYFQKKISGRQDMYSLKIPRLVLSGIDYWDIINSEKIVAKQADIYNCSFSDYLDRSRPAKQLLIHNYPHQVVMKIKMKMAIEKINLHNMKVAYEEFNPNSQKSATLYFDDINGQLINLTNMPTSIKKNKFLTLKAKTLFMHKVPVNITFNFNLSKVKTGGFTADIHAGAMDNVLINPLAEPLGLFTLRKGNVKEVTAHISGDNYSTRGNFTMLYDDLYIVPLGKDEDNKDGFKKKNFAAFLANFLLIKNANPDKKGNTRKHEFTVMRETHPNYFNQLWKTILFGIIKTIGAPESMAK